MGSRPRTSNTRPCGFFRLPRELRDVIYSHCCYDAVNVPNNNCSPSGVSLFTEPPIAQASRITREECFITFYAETDFKMIVRVNMAPRKYENQTVGQLVLDRSHMSDFLAKSARFHTITLKVESPGLAPCWGRCLWPQPDEFCYGILGLLILKWRAGSLNMQMTEMLDRTLVGCQWQKHQVEVALLRGQMLAHVLVARSAFDGFSLQHLEDMAAVLA
ncbi:hypothetical protein LTR86_007155 [Recurvomyces mirabilis]|nr:hypothetical protein LTR86_007155 [Recurvomyces mirabilis]